MKNKTQTVTGEGNAPRIGRPKDKTGDKQLRAKAKAEILAAREAYEGNAPRVMNYNELDAAFSQVSAELEQVTAQRDELLAAAKQAHGLFSSLLLSEPVKATVDGQSYVLRQLQAAIAKAEGRAQ